MATAAAADTIDLSAGGRYFFGDQSAFARPDYDDGHWLVAARTASPNWADLGASPAPQVKWERLRFTPDASEIPLRPALYMGVVAGADRVYLNGVQIGATNNLASGYNTWRVRTNRLLPRVYPIPAGLLRPNEPNILAIRFARFALDPSGVVQPPVQIAEQSESAAQGDAHLARYLAVSAMQLALNLLVVLVVIAGLVFGLRSAPMLWLLATTVMFLPSAVLSSTALVHLGVHAPPIAHVYSVKLAALAIAPLISFAAATLNQDIGRFGRGLQILQLLIFAAPPELVEVLGDRHWIVVTTWAVGATFSLAMISYWAMRAVLKGRMSSFPLLVGLMALTVGLIADGLDQNRSLALHTGAPAIDIMVTIFLLCLLVMGGLAHIDTTRKLSQAQSSILRSHETERRRFAYDVHDGIGQWLTTIKLNLQMLRSEQKGTSAEDGLNVVVDQIDEAIADTRRIAHDLSPVMLEREGLVTTMRSHAEMIAKGADIEISVTASDPPAMAQTQQGHLYRVFQEALQNSIRHGGATEIAVDLSRRGATGRLTIRDNGAGLPANDMTPGLGAASISERALLLGGQCHIENNADGGVTVEIVFPESRGQ